jgi:hypothetical protein
VRAPKPLPLVVIALLASHALDASEALLSKSLDLSTRRGSQSYFVVLASRGRSSTGHAFVVWGIEDDAAQHSTVRALGLYPDGERDSDNCGSAVHHVPGRLMDEFENHSVQAISQQLIVRVDRESFDRSVKLAREWGCRREFSLLKHDCVEFLRAVGEAFDLPMPTRRVTRWTPEAYVRALLTSMNEGIVAFDGVVYDGSLVNGKPFGRGLITLADGSRIECVFRGGGGSMELVGVTDADGLPRSTVRRARR